MSFASLLNKTCDIEVSSGVQCPLTGEIKPRWTPLYHNIKCRMRTRNSEERNTASSKYKMSTHALYIEYLKLEDCLLRIIIDGAAYHVSGQLNMGGGHEYLCLYLEIKK